MGHKPWYKKWWGVLLIIWFSLTLIGYIVPESMEDESAYLQPKTLIGTSSGISTDSNHKSGSPKLTKLDYMDCEGKVGENYERCKIHVITFFGTMEHCVQDVSEAQNPQLKDVCKYQWSLHSSDPSSCNFLTDFRKSRCMEAYSNNANPKSKLSQMDELRLDTFSNNWDEYPNYKNYNYETYDYTSTVRSFDYDRYKLFVGMRSSYGVESIGDSSVSILRLYSLEGEYIATLSILSGSVGPKYIEKSFEIRTHQIPKKFSGEKVYLVHILEANEGRVSRDFNELKKLQSTFMFPVILPEASN